MRASAVGAELVVHVLGDLGLAGGELGFLAACSPARASGVEAIAGAFGHQRVFELGDRTEDLEEHPADRRRRVNPLVEHDEVDLLGLQLLGQRHQMLERAPETIELRDDELVALARDPQGLVELGAAGELAAGLVDEHLIAAGGIEGIVLAVRVLIAGRHPPVADPHPDSVQKRGGALH